METRIAWLIGIVGALMFAAQWLVLYRVMSLPRDTIRCRRLEILNADGAPVCVASVTGKRGAEMVQFVMKTPSQNRALTVAITDRGSTFELHGTGVGDRILLATNNTTGPQLSVNDYKGMAVVNPRMVMTLDPGGTTTITSREFRVDEVRGERGAVLDLAGLRVGKGNGIRADTRR